jgi:hypothetical protein
MAMFVNEKCTLEDTFKEVIKVEKDMLSLKGSLRLDSDQDKAKKKKNFLPTKNPS